MDTVLPDARGGHDSGRDRMKKQAIAVKKNAGTMLLDFDGMIYDSMRIWHPLAKELVLSCGGVPDSRIIESMKLRDLGDYVGFLREQFFCRFPRKH